MWKIKATLLRDYKFNVLYENEPAICTNSLRLFTLDMNMILIEWEFIKILLCKKDSSCYISSQFVQFLQITAKMKEQWNKMDGIKA